MLILSNWVPNGLVSIVYGTDNTHCASIQDVGIDFGGGDIFMPEKLLDGADVIPFLQQSRGKTVAKSVCFYGFADAGFHDGCFDVLA